MLDEITFRRLAKDHLERLPNKQTRQAFLTGLSLGAREMGFDERRRACSELAAVWNIDLTDKLDVPAKRSKPARKVQPANIGQINPELAAKLAALNQ